MRTLKKQENYYATGRRKTSVSRVFLKPGTGKITINKQNISDYVKPSHAQVVVLAPFLVTDTKGKFDAQITVCGGGRNGQIEAIRHGITRALLKVDEKSYRSLLKKEGFITRDSRMVERKKYGRHKARKSTQFSKR